MITLPGVGWGPGKQWLRTNVEIRTLKSRTHTGNPEAISQAGWLPRSTLRKRPIPRLPDHQCYSTITALL